MPKKLSKEIKQVRLLYLVIVLLLIVLMLLMCVLFLLPSSVPTVSENEFKNEVTPTSEQVHELLTAPAGNKPVTISPETMDSLEGKNPPIVPDAQTMDMLSAPSKK